MPPHIRATILITLIALTAPAAAGAATWSAPVVVAPPSVQGTAGPPPLAFAAGAGSLVVGADGAGPWLARGDARGSFTAPTALAPTGTSASSADADLGSDGTLAVAWAASGVVHVTVVPAGQAPRAPMEIVAPGAGATAVAVAPDGALTLAYRTKVDKTYAVQVASAPAGGGFGTPVTIESGSAAVDAPDVAAGAGGAAAVTYRKILTRYRARVAVRPAGAPAFEAPETMPGGDQAVIRTQVAIGGDGHVVVTWVDGASASAAARAPGATTFAAPQKLADGAFALRLVPTPQGGTAATWSGSGSVSASVRPPAGAFGAPVSVGTYTSPIVSDPAIAVSPSGIATVAFNDPGDGAIRVADLGAASRIVGYGAPAAANAPALAQSATLAVVAWRDVSGAVAAATRSDTAPAGSPGAAPPGPDRTKPGLKLLTRSRTLRVTRRTTTITIRVSSDEPVSYSATADLMTRRGRRIAHAPTRPYVVKALRSGARAIRLTLGGLATKDLRRALKAGRKADLSIDLTAADRAGNSTRKIIRLKLHG